MKKSIVILSLCLSILFLFNSCKKGAGIGGRATIQGSVYARNYSSTFILNDSGFIGGQKVYIKYGDETGVGDNVETDNLGEFEFPYLRKGTYTIYVYSKQLINNHLDVAIVKTVEVQDKKETVTVPQFDIVTFKN